MLKAPANLQQQPGAIDQIVLTPRLMDFCSGRSGRVRMVFNFLVARILRVEYQPDALQPGLGLATVLTPSGRTLAVPTPALASVLQQAVAQARA
jgi:hypothetical protein